VFLRGSEWFITSPEWRLLSSAIGVLIVLLIIPGGLASLVIKVRDRLVTLIVKRNPVSSTDTVSTESVNTAHSINGVEHPAAAERSDGLEDRTPV
jgi:hypothetical protein